MLHERELCRRNHYARCQFAESAIFGGFDGTVLDQASPKALVNLPANTGRTSVCLIALAFGGASPAVTAQEAVPLPPSRPPDLATPAPTPVPETTVSQPTAGDNDTLRSQVIASRRVVGEVITPIIDKGGCGIAAPLRLQAIVLADGSKVTISPAVIMRASLAAAVADWVRDDLEPAIAAKGDRLVSIEGAGGYACRSRDSIPGAKLSEHATGNALDVHALRTEHGKVFAIAVSNSDPDDVRSFRALMKKTACSRFSTVLGPGADLYHEEHLHIDLAVRRNGMHLCQWTVQDVAAEVGATEKP
jgi:hypothetical protein